MSDFISLTCPSCGGKLQVTKDMRQFACQYCGTEQIVRLTEGAIYLTPLVDGLNQVKAGVDRTASELAINRLREEIATIELHNNKIQKEIYAIKEPKFPLLRVVIGIVLFITGLLVLLSSGNQIGTGIFCIVIGALFAGLTYWSHRRDNKTHKWMLKSFQSELDRSQKILDDKQSEIEQHLQAVSFR